MAASQYVGTAIVAAAFGVILVGTVAAMGWKAALSVWAFAITMTAILLGGIGLATGALK